MREETYSDQAIEMRVMGNEDEPIYCNVGNLKSGTRRSRAHALRKEWSSSPYKVAALCLGLLVIVQLAGIIGMSVHRHHYNSVTKERDFLRTRNNILTKENRELYKEYFATCPAGWKTLNNRCYYISKGKRSWKASRKYCQNSGADLVIINSRKEQQTVLTFNKRVWIGLSDIEVESTWKWVDGTPLNRSLLFWGSPPDNGRRFSADKEEDCVEINLGYQDPVNKWNDLNCTTPLNWICEMFCNVRRI